MQYQLFEFYYLENGNERILSQILCVYPKRTSVWQTLTRYLNNGKAEDIGYRLINR